jgi:hypothetical protein
MTGVRDVGERVEELLAGLRSAGGSAGLAAEELVSLLVGLYGDGLGRIVATLAEAGQEGTAILPSWPTIRWWRACCCCTTCTRWMSARGSSAPWTRSGRI